MLNNIKKKQIYPDILGLQISLLYKKKGDKLDLNSDRGVFNVVRIRSMLVYNDKYSIIDENMSSSNIGARKNRTFVTICLWSMLC